MIYKFYAKKQEKPSVNQIVDVHYMNAKMCLLNG